MRIAATFLLLLLFSGCGGGSGGAPPPPPPPSSNRPPAFTSAAAVSVPENSAGTIYQAVAPDPDGNAVAFSIAGGADAARFTITSAGALAFSTPADFEAPGDGDRNNVYLVRLNASDGMLTASLDLAVTVSDVAGETFAVPRVAAGLNQPLYVAPLPGDTRVLVLEKAGRILLLDPASAAAPTLFMTVAGTISTDGERGLLGFAAALDYASTGIFFLYVTNPAGDIEIRRYSRLDANQGNPASGDVILTIAHRQFSNHNGGWLGFGPDGFLYLATGDGGGTGDPLNNAQNRGSLLGKILRIDVRSDAFPTDANRDYAIPSDNPGFAAPEVYAYGLRSPFRASFDGEALLIGDVGQGAIEEVDLLRRADAGGNYGWPFLEGTRPFQGTAPAGTKLPVLEYEHGTGPLQGRTVTGGYVYRGPVLALRGLYIFGDFISGNIWSLPATELIQGTTLTSSRFTRRNVDFAADLGTLNMIVSFGEDSQRNLFIVDFDGEIFMIQARQ